MLVYGIRCGLTDLVGFPTTPAADYYMDYELLVFPAYSKPTAFQNYGARLNRRFFHSIKRIIENGNKVHEIDLEQPYISDEEDTLVKLVQETSPGAIPAWYHVPRVVNPSLIVG